MSPVKLKEVPIWIRNFKMFGSSQTWADFTILPFSEQGLLWVLKYFCGTLPSMPIYFFQTIWVFKPDKNRQNQTCGSGRRGYEMWSKFDGKRAALHPHLSDEKFGLHGLLDSQGGEQRRRNRSDLILNKAAKIIVSALTISDSSLSISGWMEFSVLKWSIFLCRNFKMFGS